MTRTTAPNEVAYWGEKLREATTRRNQAIRRMKDEGASLRTIAVAAGLSHGAVAKILAR